MEEFDAALGFALSAPALARSPLTHAALESARAACAAVRSDLAAWVCEMPGAEPVPFTPDEVLDLLAGTTVGGYRLEDEWQLINRARAWSRLLAWVEAGRFFVGADTLVALNDVLARDADLQWGLKQDRLVPSGGVYRRGSAGPFSDPRFDAGIEAVEQIGPTIQRGIALFLFLCLHRFVDTYNEASAWLMMNGELLAGGLKPFRLPEAHRIEWNMRMMHFYDQLDGNEFAVWAAQLHEKLHASSQHREQASD
ncbi:MAG TPA: hypothetical protein VFA48_05035 [Gammaproteobacteria bacterium]|nr:hypothetical protein [Gammaproteobacteria bacterium]